MAWSLPDFNLSVDVYTATAPPPALPRYRSVCAWVVPRRTHPAVFNTVPIFGYVYPTFLLLPPGLDLRSSSQSGLPDFVVLVGMTGLLMMVYATTLVGAGHGNEHLQAMVAQYGTWPSILPSPTPNPPV